MKFPKSMHAEGWASHLEETRPEHLPDALKSTASAKPAVGPARFKPSGAGAKIDIHAPLSAAAAEAPRVEPAFVRPQPATASRPAAAAIERDRQMSWMIPAGAGAAIIAAVAIWAMNRPSTAPVTPPALVVGSAEQPTQVAEATPAPEVPAASQAVDSSTATTTVADATPAAPIKPEAVEPAPAKLGPPVTTTRPAVEPRTVAQASTPPARPDMVVRAAPTSPAATLPPPTTVAAAPANTQPLSVPPGNAPIVMPPTAAGPVTTPPAAVPPVVAATPPLASATPDANAASSVATGAPPLAQAQPAQPLAQAQPVQPVAEDSGITVKVRMALAADATLAAVPIAVSTDHGVVKLEGQAPDTQTRERATVVASSAAGVKAVDNRLTLPPATVVSQAPSVQQ